MKIIMKIIVIGFFAGLALTTSGGVFKIGADVSWITQMEKEGVSFKDADGTPQDVLAVLKGFGMDVVRLRVWVNPSDGWCNAADTLAKAKRARAAGMDVMIDFHYSDVWADPGHQHVPAAWKGHDLETLKEDISAHTEAVLNLLRENGVEPKWVQVGNETGHGFLWEPAKKADGETIWEKRDGLWQPVALESVAHAGKNPTNYAALFSAGYAAVKRVFPSAQVVVHIEDGWNAALLDRNLDILHRHGAKWDVFGVSLYPSCRPGEEEKGYRNINLCMANLRRLGAKWKCGTMVVETGVEPGEKGEWAEAARKMLAYIVREARVRTDGFCQGVLYWEPESTASKYRCGLFTADGRPGAAMAGFKEENFVLSFLKGTPSAHEAPRDILVNKPDYVVFVPRQSHKWDRRDPKKTGDTYNDHFQVLNNPSNGHYYAFWTQATKEGDIDHHVAFSKSLDGGVTWTDPVIVAGSPNRARPMAIASWQQPMLSKSGRLYCLWCQQVAGRGLSGALFGVYSDDEGETWSAPRDVKLPRTDADDPDPAKPAGWIQWQRPLRQGPQGQFFVATSRHGKAPYDDAPKCKIEFWQYENIDDNPKVEDIKVKYFATNRDALDVSKIAGGPYFKPAKEAEALEEASVVKLPDGRLFALMRSSIGHPVWTQSRDGGKTWSGPKALRDRDGGKPYLHPRSPCPMYDWKGEDAASGMYFALVHNKFDFKKNYAYQDRGPLYLIAGRFNPAAKDQPVEFSEPKLFAPRPWGNSFYTSYTVQDGKGILWFNDLKFYLLGREVGPEWFDEGASATVDFTKPLGRKVRALNGGNLGPLFSIAGSYGPNTNDFAALRIPMTRLHDAPLANAGMRIVDVHHIFGNERADPRDPANYYFTQTDDYIARIRACGSEIMYRLGTSIEHSEAKYYAHPPADMEKWAETCLGIVRHYNGGWANGHKWNIRYWEIWNEPDLDPRTWTGTMDEFCRLYETTAKKIKAAFPDVKVGGPSFARFHPGDADNASDEKARQFLAYCRDRKLPLDFFSWHRYGNDLKAFLEEPARVRQVLDSYGFDKAELVFDEWHYRARALSGSRQANEDPVDGLASMNAAAFAVAAMVGWQDTPLDMSCHYTIGSLDERWGAWDMMFGRNKLFYALRSFAAMLDYSARTAVASDNVGLQVLAGRNAAGKRAVLVVNFKTGTERVRIVLKGAGGVRFASTTLNDSSDEVLREVVVPADGTLLVEGAPPGRSSVTLLTEL